MRLRSQLRALPTLFKVGFSEAVAYRAEMIVWVLATTMPLVMYLLWSAVAREAPVGSYGQEEFLAYFLAAFIVRQLTGSWASWQMNYEVRQGILSMRLLRPIHPIFMYATENWAYMPMRILVTAPAVIGMLLSVGTRFLPGSVLDWGMFFLALFGGWATLFLINVCVGTLALFVKSSIKFMDAYQAMTFVLSGYLIPVELFPARMRAVIDWLPFRFTIGLPVELLSSRLERPEALVLLARQWGWIALLFTLATVLWRRGLRRFEAYGG